MKQEKTTPTFFGGTKKQNREDEDDCIFPKGVGTALLIVLILAAIFCTNHFLETYSDVYPIGQDKIIGQGGYSLVVYHDNGTSPRLEIERHNNNKTSSMTITEGCEVFVID